MNFNEQDMSFIKNKITQAQVEITETTGLVVTLVPRLSDSHVKEGLNTLFIMMCECWGVGLAWVSDKSRANDRPMLRKLLWMAGREKYPVAPYSTLAMLTGATNHVTALRGIQIGNNWLKVRDEKFMRYYKQVKHFFDEPVDE
jgi:hypothetical protein